MALLKAATYLHDIDKVQTLKTGKHGLVAYEYLKDKYPEVAEVVVSHVKILVKKYPLDTWEKKILFYCDKITQDDKLVLFEDRIDFLKKRDGKISEEKILSIRKAMPIVKKTEKEIFCQIGIPRILRIILNESLLGLIQAKLFSHTKCGKISPEKFKTFIKA